MVVGRRKLYSKVRHSSCTGVAVPVQLGTTEILGWQLLYSWVLQRYLV